MAQILDVEGGGLGRDGLPLGPLLLLELRLLVDLLGGRLEDGAVFVQLVLEPLDELVLLVELKLQLVDERVALAQLLDLLLESVLEVAQGAHRSGWLERLFIPTSLLLENKSYAKKKRRAAQPVFLNCAGPTLLSNFIPHGQPCDDAASLFLPPSLRGDDGEGTAGTFARASRGESFPGCDRAKFPLSASRTLSLCLLPPSLHPSPASYPLPFFLPSFLPSLPPSLGGVTAEDRPPRMRQAATQRERMARRAPTGI